MDKDASSPTIAVVLPCFNEEAAIGSVVADFRRLLPEARVYVFDNASTDATADVARAAGAEVQQVHRRGKGNVVQAMFRDVDADIYVLTDGDGTYPVEKVPEMIRLLCEANADIVVGNRIPSYQDSASRKGHLWGNNLITQTVNYLFDADIQDLLSGYRVMSHRFVKSIPLFSEGFEVETAISIHAVEVGAKMLEVPIEYAPRAEGSESKLNTFQDGAKILWEIFRLYKDHKPKVVYGILAVVFAMAGLLIGLPVVYEFLQTGLVPRFPSAILASGLMVLSFLCGFTGIILSALAKSRKEIKKLAFLAMR